MATLQELRELMRNSDMMEKAESAIVIAAQGLLDGTPTTEERKWAAYVFSNPSVEARKGLMSILAVNEAASVAVILAAPEATFKSQIAAIVDTLVIAYNANLGV